MSTSNELATFFVEASKALEDKPALEAKIAELEAQLQALHGESTAKDEQIASQAEVLSEMDKKLAEVTKERDDATFRELQARDHLENLFKAIHGAADTANKAKDELNPPKSEPEMTQTQGDPTQPLEPNANQENVPSSVTAGSKGQSDFPPSPADSTSTGLVEHTEGSDFPLSDTGSQQPQSVTGSGQSEANPISPISPSEKVNSTGASLGNSAGPFASTADAQPQAAPSESGSNAAPTTDTGSVAPQSADASQPKPYWYKPTTMTWNEWEAQGNVVPEWVQDKSGT